MRNTIIVALQIVLCASIATSQITMTSADMPAVGDTLFTVTDTMPSGISEGNAGANQVWDFSGLNSHVNIISYVVNPSGTPDGGNFPNANQALTSDFVGYLYARSTASNYKLEGFSGDIAGLPVVVEFSPPPDLYQFPTQYQNQFSGTYSFDETADGSSFGVYEIRVEFTSNYTDLIDGWGTTKTPVGDYNSLRQKRVEVQQTDVSTKLCSFCPWTPLSSTQETVTNYYWLSQETKGNVVSLGYDSLGNLVSATYSLLPPPPVSGFTHNNGSGGLVNFTNTAQGTPDAYLWDFGDGSTSSMPNPVHVFDSNSVYYVCLTVTNASGSDMFCDSVTVTGITGVNNPPIANDDMAGTLEGVSVTVNVLVNDQDPDGDNISFQSVISVNGGTAIHLGGGAVEFTPSNGFTGTATFEYNICDDGNPVLCDTGTVEITVTMNTTNNPPIAVDDTANTLQEQAVEISVLDNDSDPDADNFFVSAVMPGLNGTTAVNVNGGVTYTPANGFSGADTFAYVICDDGNPVMCDTAMVVVTVGMVSTGGILGIAQVVSVYPNPASDEVHVRLEGFSNQNITLELHDALGGLQMERVDNSEVISLDVSTLAQGVYLLRVKASNGAALAAKRLVILAR